MAAAPLPKDETKRLAALKRYRILDSPAEDFFDDITRVASFICQTPIATVTLIDEHRQWFKARIGVDGTETPREHAFCGYTILGDETLVVEDAAKDDRFAANPLVTGAPNIRFYAGAPLIDRDGFALGSLCVIDRRPRQLDAAQYAALKSLARAVISHMEFRRVSSELADALADLKTARHLVPICSHCKSIRSDSGFWNSVEQYIRDNSGALLSHGICPDCLREHYPEVHEQLLREGKANLD